MEPGEAARARVDGLLAQAGLQPRGFIHLHPTARWLFMRGLDADARRVPQGTGRANQPDEQREDAEDNESFEQPEHGPAMQ